MSNDKLAGAGMERNAFRAFVKRHKKAGHASVLIVELENFIKGRVKRYRKKKGGL